MFGKPGPIFIDLAVAAIIIGSILGAGFALAFSLAGGEQSYLNKLKRNMPPALGFSIPIVLVALVAGYLTGSSRSPVVGTIIPAVLALFGGLNVYFFGIESKNRAIVGYSIFIFTLIL